MTRLQKFKLALARLLLVRSGHEVVKTNLLDKAQEQVWYLNDYVQRAGGFSSPRRIQARQRTLLDLGQIDYDLRASRIEH